MGNHLIDGEFQSDKYPDTPRGLVPLKPTDPMAQDLLWQYAQRRREVDAEFADDLEQALKLAGYDSNSPKTVGEIAERGPHGLPVLWLTWLLRENGLVELRAVSISHRHRNYSRDEAKRERDEYRSKHNPVIRYWVEKIEADHLFAQKEMMALAAMTQPKKRPGP